jgi:hypothetical protein
MKKLFFLAFLFCSSQLFAQKYSGQWSGSFDAKGDPTQSRTEYFLELEVDGTKVEGTSTTYFIIEGKRLYTICKVTGTLDPNSKTIVAKEIARIKANTPEWFKDCFQEHTLTYFKKGDTEELEGSWKGSTDTKCGVGTTVLSRKKLVKNIITTTPAQNNGTVRTNPQTKPAPQKPTNKTTTPAKPKTGVAKTQPKKETPVTTNPAITKVDNHNETQTKPEIKPNIPAPKLPNGLEKRDSKGEVVASQKTLSDKPITLKLKATRGKDNTLTMYADNQGRIPPNTAIMRVQNGDDYYKIFLSADDKKNGSVVFRFKS